MYMKGVWKNITQIASGDIISEGREIAATLLSNLYVADILSHWSIHF